MLKNMDKNKTPFKKGAESRNKSEDFWKETSFHDKSFQRDAKTLKNKRNTNTTGGDRFSKPFEKRSGGDKKFGSSDRPKFGGSDRPQRTFDNNSERPKFGASDRPLKSFDSRERTTPEKPKKKSEFSEDGVEQSSFLAQERADNEANGNFENSDSSERKTRSSTGGRGVFGKSPQPRLKSPDFRDKRLPDGWHPPRIADKRFTKDEDMRLNKYLAICGVAARRASAEIIASGRVRVNGEVLTEIGYRVTSKDNVTLDGKSLKPVEDMIYLLLNKPKDTITTASDEFGRRTVLDIVGRTVKARIFPVGRLDRDTTGLLLLTNDGDLAQKMAHPSYKIKKVYHVTLDKALTKNDFISISEGVPLEDGLAEVDAINFVEGETKKEIIVELHIGKNRIVRRIFEHLGYEVERLDRVFYGGLNKKDLPRGHYRKLTEREIIMLKHFTGR